MKQARCFKGPLARATRALLAVTCVLSIAGKAVAQVDSAPPLDEQTRLEIATLAQQKFDKGMSTVATDPEQAEHLFLESASGYQQLVDLGIQNGELFFNLGNARVQSGENGHGIGSLLDAQRLLPGDPRVLANLAHARSLVSSAGSPSAVARPLDRIAASWSGSPWTSHGNRLGCGIILWAVLWLTLAAGIATGWSRRIRWRGLIGAVAALVFVVSATLAIDFARARMDPLGVVVRDGVIARKGNGDGFAAAFTDPLKQGVEFALVEARPGWYRIELADGQSGWVKVSDAHVASPANRLGG